MHRLRQYVTDAFLVAMASGAFIFTGIPHVEARPNQWVRVSSDHFSVLTDGGEKKGRQVAVRFEQMRAVMAELLQFNTEQMRMPEPLDIVAFDKDSEYAAVAPVFDGLPTTDPAFFVPGGDRNYIVLNLFEPDSWRSLAHQFAHLYLNYDLNPSQPWFDEGFAEYFSTIDLNDTDVELGSDPEMKMQWREDIFGNQFKLFNAPRSLTDILESPVWLAIPDLFTLQHRVPNYQEGTHHTLFYAQSWIVVHYLLNKNKIEDTKNYFDLVRSKIDVNDAILGAFGMSAIRFDQEVKDYRQSLWPLFRAYYASLNSDSLNLGIPDSSTGGFAAPLKADDIATSASALPDAEAEGLLAEMELRSPQHRADVLSRLHELALGPSTQTAACFRALAWAAVRLGNVSQAATYLSEARGLDPKDPWGRYELALLRNAKEQFDPDGIRDLQIVLKWDPDFAAAHYLLSRAYLKTNQAESALREIESATSLSPRDENYQLQEAFIFAALHDTQAAAATLESLKHSDNPQIARAARNKLSNLESPAK